MYKKFEKPDDRGFTILELLIATTVFSVLLLIIVVSVMIINNEYYRGLTVSETQSVAQNLMNTITNNIQFSSSAAIDTFDSTDPTKYTPTTYGQASMLSGLCIGTQYFGFYVGRVQGSTDSSHNTYPQVAWTAPDLTCQPNTPVPYDPTTGTSFLADNMRLSELQVVLLPGSTDVYQITVQVVYAKDSSPSLVVNPYSGGGSNGGTTSCILQIGSQFCSSITLSSIVQRRH